MFSNLVAFAVCSLAPLAAARVTREALSPKVQTCQTPKTELPLLGGSGPYDPTINRLTFSPITSIDTDILRFYLQPISTAILCF